MGQTLYGPDDVVMVYLLAFVAGTFAVGLIYYRELYKKAEHSRKEIIKNQWQWQDWGE